MNDSLAGSQASAGSASVFGAPTRGSPAHAPAPPDVGRLRSYLRWSIAVGVVFFAVYPTMNWLTSLRTLPLRLFVPAELAVPFVPELVWVYLSLYLLFLLPPFFLRARQMPSLGKQLIAGALVCGLLFLLLPAELGFARAAPAASPYAEIYAAMFDIDRPHNLVPSLHVVFTAAIALACADVARPAARAVLLGWLALIATATLLVHQHHVLDVASALILVFLLRRRYEVTHA